MCLECVLGFSQLLTALNVNEARPKVIDVEVIASYIAVLCRMNLSSLCCERVRHLRRANTFVTSDMGTTGIMSKYTRARSLPDNQAKYNDIYAYSLQ